MSDRAAANQRSDIPPVEGVEAGTEAEHWPMKTCSIQAIPPTIIAGPMRFEQAEGSRHGLCRQGKVVLCACVLAQSRSG